ncbi:hypothetical protein TGCAST_221280 [Toxoplasma gondii CAST]|uniref:Uncharacterized protein n=1 Tax=Toxoplasma gondii CAST TaxID=943122 RepID=A0A3R7YX08_TOXGO|nr:hypothetical protein TGCAST_221280 [Toxoplasma gondii CAST]
MSVSSSLSRRREAFSCVNRDARDACCFSTNYHCLSENSASPTRSSSRFSLPAPHCRPHAQCPPSSRASHRASVVCSRALPPSPASLNRWVEPSHAVAGHGVCTLESPGPADAPFATTACHYLAPRSSFVAASACRSFAESYRRESLSPRLPGAAGISEFWEERSAFNAQEDQRDRENCRDVSYVETDSGLFAFRPQQEQGRTRVVSLELDPYSQAKTRWGRTQNIPAVGAALVVRSGDAYTAGRRGGETRDRIPFSLRNTERTTTKGDFKVPHAAREREKASCLKESVNAHRRAQGPRSHNLFPNAQRTRGVSGPSGNRWLKAVSPDVSHFSEEVSDCMELSETHRREAQAFAAHGDSLPTRDASQMFSSCHYPRDQGPPVFSSSTLLFPEEADDVCSRQGACPRSPPRGPVRPSPRRLSVPHQVPLKKDPRLSSDPKSRARSVSTKGLARKETGRKEIPREETGRGVRGGAGCRLAFAAGGRDRDGQTRSTPEETKRRDKKTSVSPLGIRVTPGGDRGGGRLGGAALVARGLTSQRPMTGKRRESAEKEIRGPRAYSFSPYELLEEDVGRRHLAAEEQPNGGWTPVEETDKTGGVCSRGPSCPSSPVHCPVSSDARAELLEPRLSRHAPLSPGASCAHLGSRLACRRRDSDRLRLECEREFERGDPQRDSPCGVSTRLCPSESNANRLSTKVVKGRSFRVARRRQSLPSEELDKGFEVFDRREDRVTVVSLGAAAGRSSTPAKAPGRQGFEWGGRRVDRASFSSCASPEELCADWGPWAGGEDQGRDRTTRHRSRETPPKKGIHSSPGEREERFSSPAVSSSVLPSFQEMQDRRRMETESLQTRFFPNKDLLDGARGAALSPVRHSRRFSVHGCAQSRSARPRLASSCLPFRERNRPAAPEEETEGASALCEDLAALVEEAKAFQTGENLTHLRSLQQAIAMRLRENLREQMAAIESLELMQDLRPCALQASSSATSAPRELRRADTAAVAEANLEPAQGPVPGLCEARGSETEDPPAGEEEPRAGEQHLASCLALLRSQVRREQERQRILLEKHRMLQEEEERQNAEWLRERETLSRRERECGKGEREAVRQDRAREDPSRHQGPWNRRQVEDLSEREATRAESERVVFLARRCKEAEDYERPSQRRLCESFASSPNVELSVLPGVSPGKRRSSSQLPRRPRTCLSSSLPPSTHVEPQAEASEEKRRRRASLGDIDFPGRGTSLLEPEDEEETGLAELVEQQRLKLLALREERLRMQSERARLEKTADLDPRNKDLQGVSLSVARSLLPRGVSHRTSRREQEEAVEKEVFQSAGEASRERVPSPGDAEVHSARYAAKNDPTVSADAFQRCFDSHASQFPWEAGLSDLLREETRAVDSGINTKERPSSLLRGFQETKIPSSSSDASALSGFAFFSEKKPLQKKDDLRSCQRLTRERVMARRRREQEEAEAAEAELERRKRNLAKLSEKTRKLVQRHLQASRARARGTSSTEPSGPTTARQNPCTSARNAEGGNKDAGKGKNASVRASGVRTPESRGAFAVQGSSLRQQEGAEGRACGGSSRIGREAERSGTASGTGKDSRGESKSLVSERTRESPNFQSRHDARSYILGPSRPLPRMRRQDGKGEPEGEERRDTYSARLPETAPTRSPTESRCLKETGKTEPASLDSSLRRSRSQPSLNFDGEARRDCQRRQSVEPVSNVSVLPFCFPERSSKSESVRSERSSAGGISSGPLAFLPPVYCRCCLHSVIVPSTLPPPLGVPSQVSGLPLAPTEAVSPVPCVDLAPRSLSPNRRDRPPSRLPLSGSTGSTHVILLTPTHVQGPGATGPLPLPSCAHGLPFPPPHPGQVGGRATASWAPKVPLPAGTAHALGDREEGQASEGLREGEDEGENPVKGEGFESGNSLRALSPKKATGHGPESERDAGEWKTLPGQNSLLKAVAERRTHDRRGQHAGSPTEPLSPGFSVQLPLSPSEGEDSLQAARDLLEKEMMQRLIAKQKSYNRASPSPRISAGDACLSPPGNASETVAIPPVSPAPKTRKVEPEPEQESESERGEGRGEGKGHLQRKEIPGREGMGGLLDAATSPVQVLRPSAGSTSSRQRGERNRETYRTEREDSPGREYSVLPEVETEGNRCNLRAADASSHPHFQSLSRVSPRALRCTDTPRGEQETGPVTLDRACSPLLVLFPESSSRSAAPSHRFDINPESCMRSLSSSSFQEGLGGLSCCRPPENSSVSSPSSPSGLSSPASPFRGPERDRQHGDSPCLAPADDGGLPSREPPSIGGALRGVSPRSHALSGSSPDSETFAPEARGLPPLAREADRCALPSSFEPVVPPPPSPCGVVSQETAGPSQESDCALEAQQRRDGFPRRESLGSPHFFGAGEDIVKKVLVGICDVIREQEAEAFASEVTPLGGAGSHEEEPSERETWETILRSLTRFRERRHLGPLRPNRGVDAVQKTERKTERGGNSPAATERRQGVGVSSSIAGRQVSPRASEFSRSRPAEDHLFPRLWNSSSPSATPPQPPPVSPRVLPSQEVPRASAATPESCGLPSSTDTALSPRPRAPLSPSLPSAGPGPSPSRVSPLPSPSLGVLSSSLGLAGDAGEKVERHLPAPLQPGALRSPRSPRPARHFAWSPTSGAAPGADGEGDRIRGSPRKETHVSHVVSGPALDQKELISAIVEQVMARLKSERLSPLFSREKETRFPSTRKARRNREEGGESASAQSRLSGVSVALDTIGTSLESGELEEGEVRDVGKLLTTTTLEDEASFHLNEFPPSPPLSSTSRTQKQSSSPSSPSQKHTPRCSLSPHASPLQREQPAGLKCLSAPPSPHASPCSPRAVPASDRQGEQENKKEQDLEKDQELRRGQGLEVERELEKDQGFASTLARSPGRVFPATLLPSSLCGVVRASRPWSPSSSGRTAAANRSKATEETDGDRDSQDEQAAAVCSYGASEEASPRTPLRQGAGRPGSLLSPERALEARMNESLVPCSPRTEDTLPLDPALKPSSVSPLACLGSAFRAPDEAHDARLSPRVTPENDLNGLLSPLRQDWAQTEKAFSVSSREKEESEDEAEDREDVAAEREDGQQADEENREEEKAREAADSAASEDAHASAILSPEEQEPAADSPSVHTPRDREATPREAPDSLEGPLAASDVGQRGERVEEEELSGRPKQDLGESEALEAGEREPIQHDSKRVLQATQPLAASQKAETAPRSPFGVESDAASFRGREETAECWSLSPRHLPSSAADETQTASPGDGPFLSTQAQQRGEDNREETFVRSSSLSSPSDRKELYEEDERDELAPSSRDEAKARAMFHQGLWAEEETSSDEGEEGEGGGEALQTCPAATPGPFRKSNRVVDTSPEAAVRIAFALMIVRRGGELLDVQVTPTDTQTDRKLYREIHTLVNHNVRDNPSALCISRDFVELILDLIHDVVSDPESCFVSTNRWQTEEAHRRRDLKQQAFSRFPTLSRFFSAEQERQTFTWRELFEWVYSAASLGFFAPLSASSPSSWHRGLLNDPVFKPVSCVPGVAADDVMGLAFVHHRGAEAYVRHLNGVSPPGVGVANDGQAPSVRSSCASSWGSQGQEKADAVDRAIRKQQADENRRPALSAVSLSPRERREENGQGREERRMDASSSGADSSVSPRSPASQRQTRNTRGEHFALREETGGGRVEETQKGEGLFLNAASLSAKGNVAETPQRDLPFSPQKNREKGNELVSSPNSVPFSPLSPSSPSSASPSSASSVLLFTSLPGEQGRQTPPRLPAFPVEVDKVVLSAMSPRVSSSSPSPCSSASSPSDAVSAVSPSLRAAGSQRDVRLSFTDEAAGERGDVFVGSFSALSFELSHPPYSSLEKLGTSEDAAESSDRGGSPAMQRGLQRREGGCEQEERLPVPVSPSRTCGGDGEQEGGEEFVFSPHSSDERKNSSSLSSPAFFTSGGTALPLDSVSLPPLPFDPCFSAPRCEEKNISLLSFSPEDSDRGSGVHPGLVVDEQRNRRGPDRETEREAEVQAEDKRTERTVGKEGTVLRAARVPKPLLTGSEE